jgi:hypothetical protein
MAGAVIKILSVRKPGVVKVYVGINPSRQNKKAFSMDNLIITDKSLPISAIISPSTLISTA